MFERLFIYMLIFNFFILIITDLLFFKLHPLNISILIDELHYAKKV